MDKTRTDRQLGSILVSLIISVRFVSALIFLYLYTNDLPIWASVVFFMAVFTDALDGYVARKMGGVSPLLGPYTDPVADFSLVQAAFVAFVIKGVYPIWLLILIIFMFLQFLLTSKLAGPVYDPLGKYYGVVLFCAIGFTLLFPSPPVSEIILVAIMGYTAASLFSRYVYLFGISKT